MIKIIGEFSVLDGQVKNISMSDTNTKDVIYGHHARDLNQEDMVKLHQQNSRPVTTFKAEKLEKEAQKNWDLFYKRNETRFFRDRHWTTREFEELLGEDSPTAVHKKVLLEVGCGVGNFVFPLLQDDLNLFVYACDFSPRAVQFLKENELYREDRIVAFQIDVTKQQLCSVVNECTVDLVSMIFVLSAIHPDKFEYTFKNIYEVMKPGGVLLFRDYGRYDMAQLRFGPGSKIADNFYVRQDGTRSYYFTEEEISNLASRTGFEPITVSYIQRRTVNQKEGIDVPRVFVQAKLRKPLPTKS